MAFVNIRAQRNNSRGLPAAPHASHGTSKAPPTVMQVLPPSSSQLPSALNAAKTPAAPSLDKNPPLGALLSHLPTTELVDIEISIRSVLYVLCDNICPIVKSLNEKRRQCVVDVQDMLRTSGSKGAVAQQPSINNKGRLDGPHAELYGSGRTGLTACTSSDLDFVVIVDGTPSAPPHDSKNNDGMSAFFRTPQSPTGNNIDNKLAAKRSRESDENIFSDEGFRSEEDCSSSANTPTGPINNTFGLTRSQRRREMGPLVRALIGQAASYRKPHYNNSNNAQSRHQVQSVNRHHQRSGTQGPPVFVGFKPIINARVPVLKCTHRATQIDVDISFSLDGAKSSDYLINRLSLQRPQCLVAARGLIVLLKHLLHEANLNDPSMGGLGSFPLCLMVVWFLESEVHRNFPIELQGSYTVLLTRFFAYYGDTFDAKNYGIDCVLKEMFSKAASNVLIIKNPLDRGLNAASACTRYFSDVRPLFQRLNKMLMAAMTPLTNSDNNNNNISNVSSRTVVEKLFQKAIALPSHKQCYEAFAVTLRRLASEASLTRTKTPSPTLVFTPTFLKSVLAPVSTQWGDEMVCEMEGIGLGMQW